MPSLQSIFLQLAALFSSDKELAITYWKAIEKNYSGKRRHYHTLQHLENIYAALYPVQHQIDNWSTLLFTLFYHDIIYNPLRADNEEQSAIAAEKALQKLTVPADMIADCKAQIMATKSHELSTSSDTNFFTDADLCILGSPWAEYEIYSNNVRREYAVYPDLLYKPGRRKVIHHFLQQERIFKTAHFYTVYEKEARNNLSRELGKLSS